MKLLNVVEIIDYGDDDKTKDDYEKIYTNTFYY